MDLHRFDALASRVLRHNYRDHLEQLYQVATASQSSRKDILRYAKPLKEFLKKTDPHFGQKDGKALEKFLSGLSYKKVSKGLRPKRRPNQERVK